jgi:AcrR family transcriptional regulator
VKKAQKTRRSSNAATARAKPRRGRPPGDTSARTRASILDAARDCFVHAGYERATNRDVAAAAGVTAGAIYQYFDSKTALYLAVVNETIDALAPRLTEVTANTSSARSALSALVREAMSSEGRNLKAAAFLAGIPIEMQRHPEIASGLVARPGSFFSIVLDVVARGVKSQEIAADKAERVVTVTIAAFIGLSVYSTTVGDKLAESATQGFIELLEGTLFQ